MKPFKAITIIFPLDTRDPKRKWTVEHNSSPSEGRTSLDQQTKNYNRLQKEDAHTIILNMFCNVYVYLQYEEHWKTVLVDKSLVTVEQSNALK